MPAVSVLLVFHRDQPFLRPAIASVLEQTWRDFELVLVDNGTGLTAEALGPVGRDPRIVWVRLPENRGIPAGHNAGVAAARGEFVALLDHDDRMRPKRLERQMARLRAEPALDFVSALAARIDAQDRPAGSVFCLPDAADHRRYAPYGAPVVTPAGMGRREALRRWAYRAEFPVAADLDFQARLTDAGRMAVIAETLLDYRWYPEQTTQRRAAEIERSRAAILLTTLRRRAGRAEDLPEALARVEGRTPAEAWRAAAEANLEEGEPAAAAYAARRSWALERTPRRAAGAARLAWRAWRAAEAGERRLVRAMFLRGPVRALDVRPAEDGGKVES